MHTNEIKRPEMEPPLPGQTPAVPIKDTHAVPDETDPVYEEEKDLPPEEPLEDPLEDPIQTGSDE